MNPLAQVTDAKATAQITSIRDYEDFLREAGGFSAAKAKILARAWKDLPGQREAELKAEGAPDAAVGELLGFLKDITAGGTQ
jgi:hypothetical protein